LPTGLNTVAVVEHVGWVVSELAVLPFTKPEYDGVMVGGPFPYWADPDDAEITSGAVPMVTEPDAYVNW